MLPVSALGTSFPSNGSSLNLILSPLKWYFGLFCGQIWLSPQNNILFVMSMMCEGDWRPRKRKRCGKEEVLTHVN